MRRLDLTPMIAAMRDRPGDFDMEGAWLRHLPSGHAFLIQKGKVARIEARCSCAELVAEPQQLAKLAILLRAWTEGYWRPIEIERAAERRAAEINRQFAAHFRPPNYLRRLRLRLSDAARAAWRELTRPAPLPLMLEPELAAVAFEEPAQPTRQSVETRETIDA
jgi:hypothetical protein